MVSQKRFHSLIGHWIILRISGLWGLPRVKRSGIEGLYLESIGRTLGLLSAMAGSRCPPLDPSSATTTAKNSVIASFVNSLRTPAPAFAFAA